MKRVRFPITAKVSLSADYFIDNPPNGDTRTVSFDSIDLFTVRMLHMYTFLPNVCLIYFHTSPLRYIMMFSTHNTGV